MVDSASEAAYLATLFAFIKKLNPIATKKKPAAA